MKAPLVYVIFYIERDYYKNINRDLKDRGYSKSIKSIVPTLSILKRIVHGKEVYEEVPVLFNYGFIRMPKNMAYNREFMEKLRKNIPGIRSWVKSPENLHAKKKKLRVDNTDIWDDFTQVAIARKSEVRHFQKISRDNRIFSLSDILKVKVGQYIILKGYPYDGIEAVILDINQSTKVIRLQLDLKLGKMDIELPFERVIDTVYSNYDPELIKTGDQEVDICNVTEEAINNMLDIKQF